MKKSTSKSALKIQKGVQQPETLNPQIKKRKKKPALRYDLEYYIHGIRNADRAILSQAITLIESTLPSDQILAQKIIEACIPFSGQALRVGITGVPGVGKSTFIETLGSLLVEKHNKKLAVLAIDPSSARNKGSILGDKTRMEKLSSLEHAFIRPSPSAGSLGGVAQKTRESIILCEAAGYNLIFVETVGVGQSETAVHSMVDFFLLLMLAGAGDELQGIKRGIMEMADGIVINKADGDNMQQALLAKNQYANALHLFPKAPSSWETKTAVCSSLNANGIQEVWRMIEDYHGFTLENGYFNQKRQDQNLQTLKSRLKSSLEEHFNNDPSIRRLRKHIEDQVVNQKRSPYQAADELMQAFLKK